MSTNNKVLIIVFIMLSILSVATVTNVWINFIDFGKRAAVDRAYSIAESVRDGLTSHMNLGAMDKRDLFLSNMIKHQNVKTLRVIRSKKVIEEFGDGGLDPYKYDDIEKDVLSHGKAITNIINEEREQFLRITIPYIATKYSKPNCLSCHVNEKEGDVLGAITLELDISEVKNKTVDTILKIILISFVFLILAFFVTGYIIKPYVKLFDALEEGIDKAYKGDFSYYVQTNLSDEAGKVAKKLNDLSEIFRFKKTIELDYDKEKIYERIKHILESNLELENFIIFENNITTKKRKIVLKSSKLTFINDEELENSTQVCRAFRTNFQVVSTDFHNICDLCAMKNRESICLPFTISDELSLTLLIYVANDEELIKAKELIPIISNYFELAEPVLQTKLLMNKLHEKSLKDPMTSLLNRRFLEQYIDDGIKSGENFSVMMVDIDFFKQVNDTYGHDVGDEVIRTLSDVLRNNIKGSDLAIRYGGEEFLLIVFDTSNEVAAKIANHINSEFSKKVFKVGEETFSKTLSIGISSYIENSISPWQAIKHADVALYNAKNSGRNKVVIFEAQMYQESMI